jgi:hypothetical protein
MNLFNLKNRRISGFMMQKTWCRNKVLECMFGFPVYVFVAAALFNKNTLPGVWYF